MASLRPPGAQVPTEGAAHIGEVLTTARPNASNRAPEFQRRVQPSEASAPVADDEPTTPATWFRFDAASFLANPQVVALSMPQRGVLVTLLALAWNGGGLSDRDAEVVALGKRFGAKRSDVERVLAEFFTARGPHGRSTPDLEADRARARENSRRGRKAARSRWDNGGDRRPEPG